MQQIAIPADKLDSIIGAHGSRREALIEILQDVQDEARYLPRPVLDYISKKLQISLGEIYHIATFYKAFSIEPKGKYVVTVCLGTACHVRGGQLLVDRVANDRGVKVGKTTPDGLVTLETVGCVGACALGPIVKVNEKVHGKMNQPKLVALMKKL